MKLLRSLSPTTTLVTSSALIVVALGGGAFAIAERSDLKAVVKIPKNSITSKHVKNGSLKAKDSRPANCPLAHRAHPGRRGLSARSPVTSPAG